MEIYTESHSGPEAVSEGDRDRACEPNLWRTKKLRLSINPNLINKDQNVLWLGRGFQHQELTIDHLAASIKAGHAYSFQYQTDRRSADKFTCTDILSVDIDHGMTLEQARAHPLVAKSASLIYTTATHTDAAHRFRIVFALAKTLTSRDDVKAAATSLAARLGGDEHATDAARFFYGNTAAEIETYDRGLSAGDLDDLIRQTINTVDSERKGVGNKTIRSALSISAELEIVSSAGKRGTMHDFAHKTSVHCPFHDDKKPSAVIYVNNGRHRIHCFSCGQTFWASTPSMRLPSEVFDDLVLGANTGLRNAQRGVVSQRFIEEVRLEPGLNFIKSPKGSGKTSLLKRAIPNDASVLLIGHRKALLRHMCQLLGLECYLDKPRWNNGGPASKRFGVTLDSLSRYRLVPSYDFVILDESEQVLAHLLSDTISEKRHNALRVLRNSLIAADRVVALDADLSTVSFDFISRWSKRGQAFRDANIFLNTFSADRGSISMFPSKEQITGDLFRSLAQSRKCFVASNSKKFVDAIECYIQAEMPEIRRVAITSDTTKLSGDPAGMFVYDPVGQSQRYQLVLATPSVGTGVDIRFDNDHIYFECVYGVFEHGPTDHFECDQQLSRVRHPGEVKVYVSAQKSFLETDPEVVQCDLRNSDIFGHLDAPNADSELLHLAIEIESGKRISKNRLKENFIRHKQTQIWSIGEVQKDPEVTKEGMQILKTGRFGANTNLIERLMSAAKLSPWEIQDLFQRQNSKTGISRKEKDHLYRAEIESFYRREIFPELIEQSEGKGWRPKIRLFESLIDTESCVEEIIADGVLSGQADKLVTRTPLIQRWLLRNSLRQTPLFRLGKFDADVRYCDKDLVEFQRFVDANRAVFDFQFERKIRKDLMKAPMIQLAAFLEMMYLKHESNGRDRVGGKDIYYYKLNDIRLSGMMKLARVRKRDSPLHECLEG